MSLCPRCKLRERHVFKTGRQCGMCLECWRGNSRVKQAERRQVRGINSAQVFRDWVVANPDKATAIVHRLFDEGKPQEAKMRARHFASYMFPGPQPCQKCGEPGERHHPDHRQPFVIEWWCKPHHPNIGVSV